jgi:hypothetical protein
MKHLLIGILLCLFVLGLSGNGITADINLTDACNANRKNSVRILDNGVTQRCDGTNWVDASSGVPKNTVAFFLQKTCPTGWYEPTAWRGLFLRAWNPSGSGPDAGRGFNTYQADMFESHVHKFFTPRIRGGKRGLSHDGSYDGDKGVIESRGTDTTAIGGSETRPKNVSLLLCIKQ